MAKLPELTKIYIAAYSDNAIQLGDAVPGFAGVEQLEDGGQYSCVVKNGVQTEKFIGTYSAGSQSLTRQTQNVYPAGSDKISLAADGLYVDFVMLGRDLPNDDSLRETLQSTQGASFVQSANGSIESRLSNLDTEIIDKVSGSLGADTKAGDGLVQGIVYNASGNYLKATYQDATGTHTANISKTPVLDSLGESTTSAISQRAATDAVKNIDLSGYVPTSSSQSSLPSDVTYPRKVNSLATAVQTINNVFGVRLYGEFVDSNGNKENITVPTFDDLTANKPDLSGYVPTSSSQSSLPSDVTYPRKVNSLATAVQTINNVFGVRLYGEFVDSNGNKENITVPTFDDLTAASITQTSGTGWRQTGNTVRNFGSVSFPTSNTNTTDGIAVTLPKPPSTITSVSVINLSKTNSVDFTQGIHCDNGSSTASITCRNVAGGHVGGSAFFWVVEGDA